jgi:hypothetical protein
MERERISTALLITIFGEAHDVPDGVHNLNDIAEDGVRAVGLGNRVRDGGNKQRGRCR